jgi:signal transduction histidine kinase
MSILAHEIRNLLAGILGYSEMGREPELAPAHLDAGAARSSTPTPSACAGWSTTSSSCRATRPAG